MPNLNCGLKPTGRSGCRYPRPWLERPGLLAPSDVRLASTTINHTGDLLQPNIAIHEPGTNLIRLSHFMNFHPLKWTSDGYHTPRTSILGSGLSRI
ncbi:MAG TPA: hypothetical protein VFD91_11560 [Mariniphaga sp.]|nr:hypothetical protein [Mariniphaga sp.]